MGIHPVLCCLSRTNFHVMSVAAYCIWSAWLDICLYVYDDYLPIIDYWRYITIKGLSVHAVVYAWQTHVDVYFSLGKMPKKINLTFMSSPLETGLKPSFDWCAIIIYFGLAYTLLAFTYSQFIMYLCLFQLQIEAINCVIFTDKFFLCFCKYFIATTLGGTNLVSFGLVGSDQSWDSD